MRLALALFIVMGLASCCARNCDCTPCNGPVAYGIDNRWPVDYPHPK